MDFNGQYLTYGEYKELGGTLDKMPFIILEFEARKEINKNTFGRIKELKEQSQEVKMCVFELVKILNSYTVKENENKNVSSESIDGYSINYSSQPEVNLKAKKIEVNEMIETYLSECKLDDGTPYLYRG